MRYAFQQFIETLNITSSNDAPIQGTLLTFDSFDLANNLFSFVQNDQILLRSRLVAANYESSITTTAPRYRIGYSGQDDFLTIG